MISQNIVFKLLLFMILTVISCTNLRIAKTLSDEPEKQNYNINTEKYDTFESALQNWKSLDDAAEWMGANFSYDMARAVNLSEKNRNSAKYEIYTPPDLFLIKKGVCVDLARFGVESARQIYPDKTTDYLLIDFSPIEIEGQIIRKHWLAVHFDGKNYYFFADSKRPGFIAGPFTNIKDFLSEYSSYRQREILSYKVLPSYKKKQMKRIKKSQ